MSDNHRRFTAARLTAGGRGAVATIRVSAIPVSPRADSGDSTPTLRALDPLFHAANGLTLDDQPLRKIAFGKWGEINGEDLVICRRDVNVLEIHCHGGEAAVQQVLKDLSNVGCAIVEWRQQVLTASGLIDVECLDVLCRTSTWRTTKIAMEQANGLLKSAFMKLSQFVTRSDREFHRQVDEMLQWADFGLHLSTAWNVVLTGRPNVGKSSLINALLGYQRAIVFDQPGTTRDVVTGETAFDGWPVVLSDTAGIRDNVEGLEAAGIAFARERLCTADLRLLLVDVGEPPTVDDEALFREWPDALVVGHKADRPDYWRNRLPIEAIRVSSITGMGLVELQRRLVDRLVPSLPVSGTPIPVTERQVQCLRRIRQSRTVTERERAIQGLLDRLLTQ